MRPVHAPVIVAPSGECSPERRTTKVSVGVISACAAVVGLGIEELFCWGENSGSQLGRGPDADDTNRPELTSESLNVTQIASGSEHHIALQADGTVVGWGRNNELQLGLVASVETPPTPTLLDHAADIGLITTYGPSSCTLSRSGVLTCFGRDTSVEASGDVSVRSDTLLPRVIPVPGGRTWSTATIGTGHGCAITADDRLYCWGSNSRGQLGVGTDSPDEIRSLSQVRPGTAWAAVSAALDHTCAIDREGALWCWGDNQHRQLGDPVEPLLNNEPQRVGADGTATWQSVGLGNRHTCGLRRDNRVYCWGSGTRGELGGLAVDAESLISVLPVEVPGTYQSLSVGRLVSCAIDPTGALYCWGRGTQGQIGNGESDDAYAPTRVCFPEPT